MNKKNLIVFVFFALTLLSYVSVFPQTATDHPKVNEGAMEKARGAKLHREDKNSNSKGKTPAKKGNGTIPSQGAKKQ